MKIFFSDACEFGVVRLLRCVDVTVLARYFIGFSIAHAL